MYLRTVALPMGMDPDDVTLVMPCYNVEETLPAALDAVDQLDPSPHQFLCIDDGSTDDTRSIIDSHESAQLLENETNKGLGATLNKALSATDTPLFAKIDADIVVPSDWLETILTVYNTHDAALVQGRFVDEESTMADQWRAEYPSPDFDRPPVWNKALNGATILADAETLREIGGYNEQYRRAFDDIDLMKRLMEAGYDIYYDPSIHTTHIRTDTWKEVLRTEWAYQNHPRRGGKPDSLSDIVRRFPHHFYQSLRCLYLDVRTLHSERLWISLLRFPYLIRWDVEHVLSANDRD